MSNEFEPWLTGADIGEFENMDWAVTMGQHQQADSQQSSPETEFALECERLREEAREKGYQEGLQQAQQEMALQKEELLKWLDFMQNPVQLLDQELSNELVHTLLWLCQHCIHIELSQTPEKLLQIIDDLKPSLSSLQTGTQLIMNPDDIAWLNENLSGKNKALTEILVADDTLVRGDFYLRSKDSELDGTLKTRLQNIFNKHLPTDAVEFDKDDQ